MKILIIGGNGYIGSVLCAYLKRRGEEYRVYDNFMYGKRNKQDIRDLNKLWKHLDWADAVVNLAGLSNDPLADIDPRLTWEINYEANRMIGKLIRGKPSVFASSCSVYGFSEEEFNVDSKLNPQTLYARCKALSEEHYDGAILRFATVYGWSPIPRFDLVVNKMIGDAYFNNKIVVNGGNQWRPVVHVMDVCRAIYDSIGKVGVYNVGSNEQNYQIKDLGKIISQNFPGCELEMSDTNDKRSYRVKFDMKAKYTIEDAIGEFVRAFKSGEIKNMTDDKYYRVKYLKKHGRLLYGLRRG